MNGADQPPSGQPPSGQGGIFFGQWTSPSLGMSTRQHSLTFGILGHKAPTEPKVPQNSNMDSFSVLGAIVLNSGTSVFEQVMSTYSLLVLFPERAGPRDPSDGGGWHVRRHRRERVTVGAWRRKFISRGEKRRTKKLKSKKDSRPRNSQNRH